MGSVIRALSIAAAVAALVVPAASFAAAPHAKISNCGKLQEHPPQLTLACADANYELSQLGWNTWGGAFARAVGEVRANDCSPNCAAGHFHTYRAQVIADKLTRCGSTKIYLRLTIDFTGKRPKGYGMADVHTWTCKQAKTH
jgi:hypothetical protein